ncbi:MAG: hypothetical protein AAB336_09105 [Acidobacteriota bacterium]
MEVLSEWICDSCGETVKQPKAYVIWKRNENGLAYGFKIIHQKDCDNDDYPSSGSIDQFLGLDGEAKLLCFLSSGPLKADKERKGSIRVADIDEFVDFFRRVQTPFYEEARTKFFNEDVFDRFSDASEVRPYMSDALQSIVNEY